MSSGSRDRPSCYLVEWYQAGLTDELLEQIVGRINRAGNKLALEGVEIGLLDALIVPDDEVAFCLFGATSSTSVEKICDRAGIRPVRISRAQTSPTAGRGIRTSGLLVEATATGRPTNREVLPS